MLWYVRGKLKPVLPYRRWPGICSKQILCLCRSLYLNQILADGADRHIPHIPTESHGIFETGSWRELQGNECEVQIFRTLLHLPALIGVFSFWCFSPPTLAPYLVNNEIIKASSKLCHRISAWNARAPEGLCGSALCLLLLSCSCDNTVKVKENGMMDAQKIVELQVTLRSCWVMHAVVYIDNACIVSKFKTPLCRRIPIPSALRSWFTVLFHFSDHRDRMRPLTNSSVPPFRFIRADLHLSSRCFTVA